MDDIKYANLLESTFIHLKGISRDKEKALWDSGIVHISQLREQYFSREIRLFDDYIDPATETELAIAQKNIDYFANKLPRHELYRAALSWYSDVIFLDIETTGLSRCYSYITLIGWIIGGQYKCLIKGESPEIFYEDLRRSKLLVTFNGSMFDIPFIRKEFPDAVVPSAHIDLRFFSKRYGYTGGQKEIEKTLKVRRPSAVGDIDGKEAVVLWYKYLSGDLNSLELLLKYNFYDILGMHKIFDKIVEKHILRSAFLKLERPIFRFSKQKVNHQTKTLKSIYFSTKQIIKSRTIDELLDCTKQEEDIKVVGIDLTGSEERPSGCCVLDNSTAFTCLINKDQDLINYVLENKPTVVSIDSPLSLPYGRTKVTDDDEGRDKYGIMRYCERELKKRGVNVYPCLIPSMQKLTARGIKIAKQLRSLGIPVIESFPGAAQDVLKIPRKRTDLHFLKQGLLEFGIIGEFEDIQISHDELDAITSALVGLFFWKGRFEALGNEEEDYLIIPGLEKDDVNWGKRKVIGFSGPIATGKTTAAIMLKEKGFHYVRFSQILESILIEEKKEINRNTLQELGNKIYKEKGQYWLCKKLVSKLPVDQNIVVDGLRHPEDHAFFSEFCGPDFVHVFIDSETPIRRERYIKDNGQIAEFDYAVGHAVEKNIPKLMHLAHIVIQNNGERPSFEESVLKLAGNLS